MDGELKYLFEQAINRVNEIVPEQYKVNMVRNINTLQMEFNADVVSQNSALSICYYDPQNNKIIISNEFLNEIKNSYPLNYKEILIKTIVHELVHMASSTKRGENDEYSCGFYTDKLSHGEELVLTEGMTDILTQGNICVSNSLFDSYYLLERCFIKQIIEIVGEKIVLDSYFLNCGLEKIKIELEKYIDKDEIDDLMFYLRVFNKFKGDKIKKHDYMANIQRILTDAFINSLKDKKDEDKEKYIANFREAIIDKHKIVCTHNYYSHFPGLDDEIVHFEESITKLNERKNTI